jgi:4-aminobutyrate aminotransferase-like enzyme/Ser/Thr protein kinase RdoA (MazF antagonist)
MTSEASCAALFTPEAAAAIALQYYDIRGTAEPLPGEHDLNFRIRAADGREFVLKIHPTAEDSGDIDLQVKALLHIQERDPSLRIPRVVRSRSKDEIIPVRDAAGTTRLARMLTWLPGEVWARSVPREPRLMVALGNAVARLDRALSSFAHPSMHRHHPWDIKNAYECASMLPFIADAEHRATAETILQRFGREVLPRLHGCPTQVIQNDANEYNVLVGEEGEIAGILDFGDIVHSFRVANLAVACAYAMLGHPTPLRTVQPLVAAYYEANPLTDAELELLLDLIRTRLAMSVCMAAWQFRNQPDNRYLLISQEQVGSLLDALGDENRHLAHFRFRDACGLQPNPSTTPVVRWIESNSDDFAAICRFDMMKAKKLFLDWSKESLTDVAAATNRIFREVQQQGAEFAIGRYMEDRGIYTSGLFQTSSGDERRTIHLGIDIFLHPGEPIFAPLDGVVHAFNNNATDGDYGPVIILEHRAAEGIPFWTLYGHLSLDSLSGLHAGKVIRKGELFCRVGTYPSNGNWAPHVHFQLLTHLLDQGCAIWGVAPASELDLWESISPNPNLILGIRDQCRAPLERDAEYLLRRRTRHLGRSLSLSYRKPLKIVRGEGQYLYGEDGRRWLDLVNNVCHVGHCHPRVVRALQEQAGRLNTNTRYLHSNIVAYARELVSTLPEPLSVCFFVNSGSEANDLALRLARTHTGQEEVLVIDHAYHGNLSSLIEISPYKFKGRGGSGCPPHVHVCELPDGYRGRFRYSDPGSGIRYAADVARKVAECEAGGRGIAAFFAESLMGCAGQIAFPPGYLQEAYRHVRAVGGVCVADEVQVGFGRVGSHWWGFETQNVVPDIVTMGKPIGNGHPLGAVVTTPEIASSFNNGMEYFNTFGGNPVSCGVGLSVLDVMRDERLQQNAQRIGSYLMEGLRRLSERLPIIGDVRGLGLFIGVELVRDRRTLEPADTEALMIVEKLKEQGILLSIDGPLHNVLKIKPPLVLTRSDASDFLRILGSDPA